MITIDIITPPVYVAHSYMVYYNEDWFPVYFHRKFIKKKFGINVRFKFLNKLNFNKLSQIVAIDCRAFLSSQNIKLRKIPLWILKKIQEKTNRLLWFDMGDSTGTTQFEVLPYVDRYFKKYLLKDLSLYKNQFALGRYFTEYYSKNYNIEPEYEMYLTPLRTKFINKLKLSWNFGLSDYRKTNLISTIFKHFFKINGKPLNLKFSLPSKNRNILIFARYSTNYTNLVSFQRIEAIKLLKEKFKEYDNIKYGYIKKRLYWKELRNAKLVLSPFGWGEACVRDFETFIAGAALLKPDMSFLQTWPNFYQNNITYIPLPWKIEKWESIIKEIINDDERTYFIAKNSQNLYKYYWTPKGMLEFCERFKNMILGV